VRRLASDLDLNDREIRRDLELGREQAFEDSKVFKRAFALADEKLKGAVPRALVPNIRLESPKITRELTTEWFARRVDDRYQKCLARGRSS